MISTPMSAVPFTGSSTASTSTSTPNMPAVLDISRARPAGNVTSAEAPSAPVAEVAFAPSVAVALVPISAASAAMAAVALTPTRSMTDSVAFAVIVTVCGSISTV